MSLPEPLHADVASKWLELGHFIWLEVRSIWQGLMQQGACVVVVLLLTVLI